MNKKLLIFVISALVFLPLFLFADTETEPNNTAGDEGVFTVENGIHDGTIQPGDDLDFFGFEASEDDVIEVSTIGLTTIDTKLWIYAEDGTTELAYNDDSGGTLQSYVTITVAEDGYFYFVVGTFSTGTGPYEVELMGANVPVHFDNDMQARFLSGNTTPTEGDATIYTATVKNQGNLAQLGADYTVELYDEGDNLVDTVQGVDLGPGEQGTVELTWTPVVTGATFIYAKTNLPGDENADNDMSDPFDVIVQAAGTIVITIGQGTDMSYQIPANFFYKSSLSECWYYPEEVNFGGLITQLAYHTNWATDLQDMPLRIWMGETDQPQAAIGWIPAGELTLVFDGTIDLPPGENDIFFALDTFFGYSGADNLVIMMERPMDDVYYSTADTWYNTDDVYHPSRTKHYYSDSVAPDPYNPPTTGSVYLSNLHPNIGLYFDNTPTGSLDGFVYGNDRDPLVGAMVEIEGTTFSTYTDETGYYSFPYVFVDTYDVTASNFGYYDQTETVVITEGQLTTQDLTLIHLPTVSVTGHVVTSDTGADVVGADVMLEGYDNYYGFTTDANGDFEVTGVFASQTYMLTIEYAGYATYVDENVVVGAVDLDLGEIIVEEVAIPVYTVIAEQDHNGDALIVWNPPGSGTLQELILDDGTYENGLAGNPGYELWLGNQFMVGSSGTVSAFTIYAETVGGAELEVDIYDADRNLVGSSETFQFIESDWVTVAVPDIPFDDEFYAMVHWNMETATSGYMGMDENGPNSTMNYDWYLNDAGLWQNCSAIGFQNVFMLRATAMVAGRVVELDIANNKTVNREEVEFDAEKAKESITASYRSGIAPQLTSFVAAEHNPTSDRLLESYNLHRLLDGDQENPGNWTVIATGISDTTYVDASWQTVAPGAYRYAVTAIYTNGVEADPGFSNILESQLYTTVTLNVTTNAGDDPAGAIAVLTNQDEDPDHVYTIPVPAGGVTVFPEVYLGVYDLSVSLDGFETFEQTDINIYNATTVPVELVEVIDELGELMIDYLGDGNVHLTWAPTGAGNVLLVDDDGSAYLDFADTQANYMAVLDEMGITYEVYDIVDDGADGPDAAYMGAFDVVIWECGEQWSAGRTLTANDEGNLADYIDAGGKLILSAHDYLYDAYAGMSSFSAGSFPYDYLGISGAAQDYFTIGESQGGPAAADVDGSAGSYVDGLMVQITDIFSTRDGVYLDELTPNDMGASYCTIDGAIVGVQTNGAIFTTAGFAGLIDGSSTVVEWFTCSMNNLFVARDRSFLGYSITRNGTEIANGVMDMEYTDVVTQNGVYEYGVTGVYDSGTSNTITAEVEVTDLDADDPVIPNVTTLNGNYPNPFNPVTNISFSISEAADVNIMIYNIKGEKVKTLVDGYMEPSNYSYIWDGSDDSNNSVASGVYFYKMKAGRYTSTKKMILMK